MFRRMVWGFVQIGYQYVAKPILFLMPPDNVHEMMVRNSSWLMRIGLVRGVVRLIFRKKPSSRLTQTIDGIDYENPVGLSAGFDKNGEVVAVISAVGYGFMTVGSVTARVCAGNPRPWFYRLPHTKSLVVNAGLANHGSRVIIDRVNRYRRKEVDPMVITMSVAKTNSKEVVSIDEGVADYITSLKRIRDVGTDRICNVEINISCPNTYGGEPFTKPRDLEKLLRAIDELKLQHNVYIKMPSDLEWLQFKKLLDVICVHSVRGVTISNLAKDRSRMNLSDPLPDTVPGNLSGAPTWELSNALIRRTYEEYGDKLTIIGVGGIFTPEQAYIKIRLGASLVAMITGMIFEGPQRIAQIVDGLDRLLERDGYTSVQEAVGVDTARGAKR